MPLIDDGDVVKSLGFVCLYSAYLEEAIDDCFDALRAMDPGGNAAGVRWPASRKLEYCKERLRDSGSSEPEILRLAEHCDVVKGLLERRNEIVHGRIYGEYNRPDTLRSARGRPNRQVTSDELIDLANVLFSANSLLIHGSQFVVPRMRAAVS